VACARARTRAQARLSLRRARARTHFAARAACTAASSPARPPSLCPRSQDIVERLAKHLQEGREELRDLYGIGIKTLLTEVSAEHGALVAQALGPHLLSGLHHRRQDVRVEMLEILQALMARFGGHTQPHHYQLLDAALKLLLDPAVGASRRWAELPA